MTALFALALWLFMAAAETVTPLHEWMHGGAIPQDDNCAVALLHHGKIETVAGGLPAVVPVMGLATVLRAEFLAFINPLEKLSNGRAPPVSRSLLDS